MRIFVDEGEEMRQLIGKQTYNQGHPLSGYTAKLLAAFPQPVTASIPAIGHQKPDLIEPATRIEAAPHVEAED